MSKHTPCLENRRRQQGRVLTFFEIVLDSEPAVSAHGALIVQGRVHFLQKPDGLGEFRLRGVHTTIWAGRECFVRTFYFLLRSFRCNRDTRMRGPHFVLTGFAANKGSMSRDIAAAADLACSGMCDGNLVRNYDKAATRLVVRSDFTLYAAERTRRGT